MKRLSALGAIAALALPMHGAHAQEADVAPGLAVELNGAAPAETGCTLSFVVVNGYDGPVDQLVFETVIFDADGQVDRLTLFDFGSLPPARPRVRQFTMPDLECDGIGRVLINGASTCEAPTLADGACMDGLQLSTRTKVELIG